MDYAVSRARLTMAAELDECMASMTSQRIDSVGGSAKICQYSNEKRKPKEKVYVSETTCRVNDNGLILLD